MGSESNVNFREFCNQQLELYKMGYSVSIDLPLLGVKNAKDQLREQLISECNSSVYPVTALVRRSHSTFEAIEKAGTECTYRCVDCCDCNKCKKAGTECTYRCVDCRDCNKCKKVGTECTYRCVDCCDCNKCKKAGTECTYRCVDCVTVVL